MIGLPLPPGSHTPAGEPLRRTTQDLIRRYARHRRAAHLLARHWRRRGCRLEALALIEATGRPSRRQHLHLLADLKLYRHLLDALGGKIPPGFEASVGLARLATGDVDGAMAPLFDCIRTAPVSVGWVLAGCALAQLDSRAALPLLRQRGAVPFTALVLGHIAARQGDDEAAIENAAILRRDDDLAREADLIEANLARLRGDRRKAAAAAECAFAFRPPPPAHKEKALPLVSIVVAAFNAAATIEASLASLLAQSWPTIEILLVDDASTDDTGTIARCIAESDRRLRVITLEENQGAYAARNRGLATARGSFVTLHDADDIADTDRIAHQLEPLLRLPGLAATTARWVRRAPDGFFRDRQIAPLIRFHTASVMVRRSFAERALGGYDLVRYGADEDFLLRLRIAAGGGGLLRLPLPLTIGGAPENSAVHDRTTGYGDRGYSIARQAYHETAVRRVVDSLIR